MARRPATRKQIDSATERIAKHNTKYPTPIIGQHVIFSWPGLYGATNLYYGTVASKSLQKSSPEFRTNFFRGQVGNFPLETQQALASINSEYFYDIDVPEQRCHWETCLYDTQGFWSQPVSMHAQSKSHTLDFMLFAARMQWPKQWQFLADYMRTHLNIEPFKAQLDTI